MPERKAQKPAKKSVTRARKSILSAEEKAAMKETIAERKAQARGATKAEEEAAVLENIAAMSPHDRGMARRIHEIVKANAPDLSARTWYGMPAYARDGKIICFFQEAAK